MLHLLILTLFATDAFAQSPLDQKLAGYIREFSMTAMSAPAPKREAVYDLGRRLFMDTQLSGKNNINCLMCHTPPFGSGDGLPLSLGEGATGMGPMRSQAQGAILLRNTPALYNLGVSSATHLFWDGRVSRDEHGWVTPEPGLNGADPELADVARTLDSVLAVQALFPIATADEMLGRGSLLSRAEAWSQALDRLLNGPRGAIYRELFFEAFDTREINIGHVGNALAEFQRHFFWSGDTPWDRYLKGDRSALTDEMKLGAIVFFQRGECAHCHRGEQLSTFDFEAVGVPQLGQENVDDWGRFQATGREADRYKFRITPLRNIALSAPYMHNGVFSTLKEVIDFYDAPLLVLRDFSWSEEIVNYKVPLVIDRNEENQRLRRDAIGNMLPRRPRFTALEKNQLECFLTVGLTDMGLQKKLQGVDYENVSCPSLSIRR